MRQLGFWIAFRLVFAEYIGQKMLNSVVGVQESASNDILQFASIEPEAVAARASIDQQGRLGTSDNDFRHSLITDGTFAGLFRRRGTLLKRVEKAPRLFRIIQ